MSYTPHPRPHITRSRHDMGGVVFIGRRFEDDVKISIYAMIALCIVLLTIAYGVIS